MTLANLARRRKHRRIPALILVTDDRRLPDPAPAMARLPVGAAVLLRHYDAPDRPALARRLASLARARRLTLILGGKDWRLAAAIGADGVHLPEGVARQAADPGLHLWQRRGHLLSVACHSRMALVRARALGADMVTLSPVFPTASHPGAANLGPTRFALWARQARLPVVALGGVNRRTALALRFAAGVAAISGLAG